MNLWVKPRLLQLLAVCAVLVGVGFSFAHARADDMSPGSAPTSGSADDARIQQLFSAGKLDDVLSELQKSPADNAPYYYNVGTVLFKLGRVGSALAYLEKANRLEPHQRSIQHNLQQAKEVVGKTIGTDRLDPASSWTEAWAENVSLDEVRGILGLSALIVFAIWIRGFLKTKNLKSTLTQPASILVGIAFAVAGILYIAERAASGQPPAIFVEQESVRSGPGPHFTELNLMDAGTKIRLTGVSSAATEPSSGVPLAEPTGEPAKTDTWWQIRYSRNGIGWVKASSLLLL